MCSFVFVGCSTPKLSTVSDAESAKHNQELMEDFKLENKVMDKFSENKKTEKLVEKKKKKKKKVIKNRNNRKVKRVKKKIIFKKKSLYPENYPKSLIAFDKKSNKFKNEFKPFVFPGEKIDLNVTYLGVSTGTISLMSKKSTIMGGKEVFHLSLRMKTSSYYSYLYEVDDVGDSFVTKDEFLPVKFSLIQRETNQDVDDLQLFDHDEMKVYTFYKRVTKNKNKKKKSTQLIPKFFQDPISVAFYIRGLPMIKGTKYEIPVVNKGKTELMVATIGGTEVLRTNIGKRKAHKVSVKSYVKGKTIAAGKMIFWYSADDRRIFLKFDAKIKLGSIKGNISKYKK